MGLAGKVTTNLATRIKFPKLLLLFFTLWLLDIFIPDPIPFFDEIMLALGTVLFGLWRERVPVRTEAPPPMKNVTPPAPSV